MFQATATPTSLPNEPRDDPFDPEVIDELRRALGAARLDELLGLLAVELVRRPKLIRAALADSDYAQALSVAHSLKGAAGNLGAMAVADAARALEWRIAAAAEGDRNRVASALYRLRLACEEAIRSLDSRAKSASLALAVS